VNNHHKEATLIEQQADLTLKDLPLHKPAHSVIWTLFQTKQLDWASETDLQVSVKLVMVDVINLAGLMAVIKLVMELGKGSDYYTTTDTCTVFANHKNTRKEDDISSMREDSNDYGDCNCNCNSDSDCGGNHNSDSNHNSDCNHDHGSNSDCNSNCDHSSNSDSDSTNKKDNLNMTLTQPDDDNKMSTQMGDDVERDNSPCVLHSAKVYNMKEARPKLAVLLVSVVYKICNSPISIVCLLPSAFTSA
jgi:hypothetical protein